jgi:hypothetical protein
MAFGVGITMAYRWTHHDALPKIGLCVLGLGFLSVCAGMVFAILGWIQSRKDFESNRKRGRRLAAVLGVLVLNFPVAGGCALMGIGEITAYHLTIRNDAGQAVSNLSLNDAGFTDMPTRIEPGQTVRLRGWIEHEGELVLTYRLDGVHHEALVDGYVTRKISGDARVVLTDDGFDEVTHPRRQGQ